MSRSGILFISLLTLTAAISSSGCLTKRTVTSPHGEVSESYVVKRPIKDVVTNLEFE